MVQVDLDNVARVTVALERWAHTGAVLADCIQKAGESPTPQNIRAIQHHINQIQELVKNLRG